MATEVEVRMPRADVVGSLLRPEYLREVRDGARAGTVDAVPSVSANARWPSENLGSTSSSSG